MNPVINLKQNKFKKLLFQFISHDFLNGHTSLI